MSAAPLRVGIDATPLLGNRTGIGQYTAHLAAGLATRDDVRLTAVPFSARGAHRPADLPPGARWQHLPIPARVLRAGWSRASFPPVELLAGRQQVFHATNFVLPPTLRAAGVVTVHDLAFLRYPELVDEASLAYRALVPRSVRRAALVLSPTRAVADEVVEAYALDPSRVRVTPLGVDPGWAEAAPLDAAGRAALGLPPEYLLAVGTVEPRKGLDVLLAAYRELVAAHPEVPPLVVVGAAGWGPALDVAGLDGRVLFPGFVPYDRLRGVVAGALVFAFPSRYEGFGLPPLEAMAAGVPVVASDIATSVEVLGGFAALPPVGDTAALADALWRALADPAPDRLAAARRHATGWTWERCVDATVTAYTDAVG